MSEKYKDYTPISMWGYFGYQILFGIPVIGLILAIIWSFAAKNQNLKNYARSQFCWLIIVTIILLVLSATIGIGALISVFPEL